ncbi:hypothetical protein [Chryseobacterium gregarium]|uniref:hypothetical protein n=1 Tax=Chryseobacterium gregarium TaxID=456299 RepID=UPI000685D97B|nr:hypothetical protein [Chryseobacterium gregarium]
MRKSESNFIERSLTVLSCFVIIIISSQKVAGDYFPAESKCRVSLKINQKNEYTFRADLKLKQKGKVKVSREDQVTYLTFDDIGSMYHQDTISIQNYGNAINDYIYFEQCDAKYIHFVRKEKQ